MFYLDMNTNLTYLKLISYFFFWFLLDICWDPWICFGTKTALKVDAVIAEWVKPDRLSTLEQIWFFAEGIISGDT